MTILRFSLLKREAHKLPVSGNFTMTYKCKCLPNKNRCKHRFALFFIQILYRLFESYVYHVVDDKLVKLPTKNGGKFF